MKRFLPAARTHHALVVTLLTLAMVPGPIESSVLPSLDNVRGIRRARIAHLNGDHAGELETLRVLVSRYPDDVSSLYALLHFHESHSASKEEIQALRAELAETIFRSGSTVPPDVLKFIATQYDDPEVLARVSDELERRVAGPNSRDRATLMAVFALRLRQEDVLAATEIMEKLLAAEPTDINRRKLLQLYEHADRRQDAADLVEAWLKIEPSAGLRCTFIDLLSHLSRLEDLRAQVELLLKEAVKESFPSTRNHYFSTIRNAAWNLRDAGHDEAAEALFRRVAELSPNDAEAGSALLYLYGSEEELQQLLAQASRFWHQQDDPQALFDEGTVRLTSGDAEGAFPLLERAAPSLPDLEPAWYNLGMAGYKLENWQVVVDAFGHAAQLNGSRVQTFLYRGLALEKLERCEEAVASLDRALTLDPSQKIAHYYLAICHNRLGRADEATKHRELYEADP